METIEPNFWASLESSFPIPKYGIGVAFGVGSTRDRANAYKRLVRRFSLVSGADEMKPTMPN